jgi:hypothetical protein
MLDETIPLTVIEWEEWGNPADKEYYDYMKSYSPVDNVHPADYPHMLVLAGLHDPRVGEPRGGEGGPCQLHACQLGRACPQPGCCGVL